jgi:hypothetical protein
LNPDFSTAAVGKVGTMSVSDHEIPASQRRNDGAGGTELAPEDITPLNRPVYLMVIGGLMLALLFGLVAWFILTLQGDDMPEGMAVLIGTIGGGLVGLITASKSS